MKPTELFFFFNETEVMQPIVGNSLLLDWTTLNITKKRHENITLKEIIITIQKS